MPDDQAVGAETPSNGAPEGEAENGGNAATDAPERPTNDGEGEEPTLGARALKWRAVVVAGLGFAAVVIVVLFAISALPAGVLDTGETDNKTPAITAIAAGAVTAIVSIVSAYFGIRSSNAAREGSEKVTATAVEKSQDANAKARAALQKAHERELIRVSRLSGAVDKGEAAAVIDQANKEITERGLDA